MHRILFTAALLAVAPVCVHAQAAPTKAAPAKAASDAASPVPRRSHNPFGAAMLELTRAAREQATAQQATAKTPAHDAQTRKAPHATPATTTSPALADADRS
ncbi:hypothetical protein [Cognatilysobacter lacus]|uniref:Secreted protein n=1 Tax=Cognatilysobacter lacus TaxID=1643323 RepID=A0A5D8Z6W2_9GAMM|nr:hypothetical protein [Lysobacter lacus]TZF89862.1 hypothetical protein FW784_07620 [Lysobacter lacus]